MNGNCCRFSTRFLWHRVCKEKESSKSDELIFILSRKTGIDKWKSDNQNTNLTDQTYWMWFYWTIQKLIQMKKSSNFSCSDVCTFSLSQPLDHYINLSFLIRFESFFNRNIKTQLWYFNWIRFLLISFGNFFFIYCNFLNICFSFFLCINTIYKQWILLKLK